MTWLRQLRCWLRGHDRIAGICVACYRGPQGQRLRPISGGDELGGEGFSDLSGFADDAAQSLSPGGLGLQNTDFGPSLTPETIAPQGGGFSKFLSGLGIGTEKGQTSPLAAFTSALGLGATGLGIANQFNVAGQIGQQTKQLQQGQQHASAAAAPAVAFGTDTLNAAAGGNLTPALQAQIDQWTQRAKADATARLASMGLGNSTDINQLYAMIDQEAMAMKGQMLQQQEETGLAGLQTGVSAGSSVMGSSQAQQAQLAQLIQGANQALGQMAGRGGNA